MVMLSLSVPEITSTKPSVQPTDISVKRWLRGLPKVDLMQRASEVLGCTKEFNRYKIIPLERFRMMERIHAEVDECVVALGAKSQDSTFPLSAKAFKPIQLVCSLLEETTSGYKLAIIAQNKTKAANMAGASLALCIHRAVLYATNQLLEVYKAYLPVPTYIWKDLHALYRHAEIHGLVKFRLDGWDPKRRAERHIEHDYKRAILLSLVNPYHLMHGEVFLVNRYLKTWTAACRIRNPRAEDPDLTPQAVAIQLQGQFVANLEGGSPPFLVTNSSEVASHDVRIFNLEKLHAAVVKLNHSARIDFHARSSKGQTIPLALRMQRDLLTRLEQTWQGRGTRKCERLISQEQLKLAVGLDTIHHVLCQGSRFVPETMESHHHLSKKKPSMDGLGLVNMDTQNWAGVDIHATKRRITNLEFSQDPGDTWDAMDKEGLEQESIEKQRAKKLMANVSAWMCGDKSVGGCRLVCPADFKGKLRMGDLFGIRISGEDQIRIGAVRWLCNRVDHSLDLGLQLIPGSGTAVAIRGVNGLGKGSDYYRALLVENDRRNKEECLIAPTAIFDIGSVLVMLSKQQMKFVKLSGLFEATKAFTSFHYQELEIKGDVRRRYELSLKNLLA